MYAPRTHVLATISLAAALALPSAMRAQRGDARLPDSTAKAGIAGPRFGITFLNAETRAKLKSEHNVTLGPVMTQFGWQFEHLFLGDNADITAVSEAVVLVGGLDQGKMLPSLTWLVGLRSRRGVEFGVGPNLNAAGVALAMAAGVTARSGSVNIPFNLAVVPSQNGVRISVLTGFTMR